jgi:hypothetical protein
MTEFRFSRDEVEDLAGKLDVLKSQLSEQEQELLLAIFSAASGHVQQAGTEGSGDTAGPVDLADLKNQILQSFIPGNAQTFVMGLPRIGPGGEGGKE